MARRKSNFYHIRKRVGLNEQRAAEILGVSVDDVQRWDIEGAPVMAERLLLLWDSKEVIVDGWAGFRSVRGVLTKGRRRCGRKTCCYGATGRRKPMKKKTNASFALAVGLCQTSEAGFIDDLVNRRTAERQNGRTANTSKTVFTY